MIQEQIFVFGNDRHLQGITTSQKKAESPKWLIIINAGVIHKVGPFNLHTHVAREVAKSGWQCLRFDLSGQGDSHTGSYSGSREERILSDISQAIDFLKNGFSAQKIVVAGLCTGFDNAHKIAVRDKRVDGVIGLDGYGYPTKRFYWHRYSPTILSLGRILRYVLRQIGLGKPTQAVAEYSENDVANVFYWHLPSKEQYRKEMFALSERGVQSLYIYTGGAGLYFNYEQQNEDAFKGESFQKDVKTVYFPQASHSFMLQQDRSMLIESICDWLNSD